MVKLPSKDMINKAEFGSQGGTGVLFVLQLEV